MNRAILVFLFLCGCSPLQYRDTSSWAPAVGTPIKVTGNSDFWDPSDLERRHAEELARWYAINNLGIKTSQIGKMKTDYLPIIKSGTPILVIGFFDPAHFTPIVGGRYSWPLGGFPAFYSIDVDASKWRVIGHYASPE